MFALILSNCSILFIAILYLISWARTDSNRLFSYSVHAHCTRTRAHHARHRHKSTLYYCAVTSLFFSRHRQRFHLQRLTVCQLLSDTTFRLQSFYLALVYTRGNRGVNSTPAIALYFVNRIVLHTRALSFSARSLFFSYPPFPLFSQGVQIRLYLVTWPYPMPRE